MSSDLVLLSPTFGNRAGGSGVLVSGPAFNTTDNVSCIFDGVAVNGVVLDNENVLCTTPWLTRTGKIPVRLMLNNVVREHEAAFYSGNQTNAFVQLMTLLIVHNYYI